MSGRSRGGAHAQLLVVGVSAPVCTLTSPHPPSPPPPHPIEYVGQLFPSCTFYLLYRPYALMSRLHNNDAMLGVKTCRAARTCCAGRAHWRSASVSARARASPAVWHAGVGPLAACLAMAHVAVPHLTPNTQGRPSVTSYAYRRWGDKTL